MAKVPKKKPEDLKFAQAMAELEEILALIRDERIDVDDLAPKVDRAAQLIKICRRKIDHTEARVREIVASLEDSVPETIDEPTPAGGDDDGYTAPTKSSRNEDQRTLWGERRAEDDGVPF